MIFREQDRVDALYRSRGGFIGAASSVIPSRRHQRIGLATQLPGRNPDTLVKPFGASAVIQIEVREMDFLVTDLHFRRCGIRSAGIAQ